MREFVAIDPNSLTPAAIYELLNAAVQPRPLALVTTLHEDGSPNLAPFSYFMVGGIQPASVMFCPVLGREGEKKNTLRNVEWTGEFVISVVTNEIADALGVITVEHKMPYREFEASGLTPVKSDIVGPPRVGESPIQLECKVHQIVTHGSSSGSANYVIGEVVRAHIASDLSEHLETLKLVGRLAGSNYIDTASGEIFTLPRPN